ncbi:hypothetical protein BDV96DRAFT_286415 [Lophiotrema nucula]|uniref:Uncharacterized protein n=1 Tax=Lophiotrema nucula TaxID=690887 RepID=A0A6A5YPA3_9PLEO|nr:hypothetical protein BDV96DRAFT_286415 [Lophiotrema nucula]
MAKFLATNEEQRLKEYGLQPKKLKVPGTYTRQNPSSLTVDILWICGSLFSALVMAGRILVDRRSHFSITMQGDANTTDFSNISPEALAEWFVEHPNSLQSAIDYSDKLIHYLARVVDPLPRFISHPSKLADLLALSCTLYGIVRFGILHRKWRYNYLLMLATYSTWLGLFLWSPLDGQLSTWTALYMVFPFLCATSVALHWFLGESAWKPTRYILETDGSHSEDGGRLLDEFELASSSKV